MQAILRENADLIATGVTSILDTGVAFYLIFEIVKVNRVAAVSFRGCCQIGIT